MKKRLLSLGLLALTMGVLASCGGKEPTPPEPGPSTPAVVPTEDGKVTFFFEENEGTVALKEYESYWLTGGFNEFATGTNALELVNLKDTKIYYVITDAPDTSKKQGNEYQIVKGYNAASKMAASKQGLQWVDNYKSNEELEFEALKNPTFEFTAGQKTIDLGKHTFSTTVTTPAEPLKNYTLSVTFKEAVPEWGQVLIFGSMNGWQTPGDSKTEEENIKLVEEAKLTPSADRKTWKVTYDSLYADKYECKILVEYATSISSVTWNTIEETQENYQFIVMQVDGDNYELPLFTDATMDFATKLPDPNEVYDLTVEFRNSTENPLKEGVVPALCGNFTNWKYTQMEHIADGDYYTLKVTTTVAAVEFGVVNNNEGGTSWVGAITGEGGQNFKHTVTELKATKLVVSADFSLLGGAEKSAGTLEVK